MVGMCGKKEEDVLKENVEDGSEYLLTCLLVPVYSLGAWAIDESSPLDPALCHGDNFLPGVPHILHFRLHVSPPGVSWPSSSLGDSTSGLVP